MVVVLPAPFGPINPTIAPSGTVDAASLTEIAAAAERAGFAAFSLTEHPIPGARWLCSGGHQMLDPLVALAHVAAATERLRLLTYLVVAPYRNPFLLAKAAATADRLSNGRLTLGLGAGYNKSEFYALGIDFEERNALFDEVLDVLPLHWRGEPSRTPMSGSLEALAVMIAEVRDAAVAAGRSNTIDLSLSYDDHSISSPTNDADRHREAFAAMEAAGVTWTLVTCASDGLPTTLDFLEAFGTTYLL